MMNDDLIKQYKNGIEFNTRSNEIKTPELDLVDSIIMFDHQINDSWICKYNNKVLSSYIIFKMSLFLVLLIKYHKV